MSEPIHTHLQDRLTEAAEKAIPDRELTFRSMFGGVSGYVAGRVFASLSNIGLAFKLAPGAQADLLKEPEAKRQRYEPEAPESKQYIVVPPAFLDRTDQLAHWVKLSVDFVLSQPAPKEKTTKKSS